MFDKLKQLAFDTVVYGASIFIGRFLTFMLVPFYTNYIPKDELGYIMVLFTGFAFANIVYSFGFESGYFRFANSGKGEIDEEIQKIVFTHSFVFIASVAILGTSLIYLFSGNIADQIEGIENGALWIKLAALIPLFDALMFIPYTRLRLKRKSIRFAITRLITVIITVALNIYLVTQIDLGGLGVIIAGAVSPFLIGLTFIPDIVRNFKAKFDKELFKGMFKYSLPTVPASLSIIALQFIDQPILIASVGPEETAIYAACYKLALPMMLFVSMFEYAWKPFYLSNFGNEGAKTMFSRVLTYYVATCCFIFLTVSLLIPYIVQIPFRDGHFYEKSFWTGLYIVPIVMGGYFFNGLFNQFSIGLNITKETKYLPIAVGVAAIVNIVGNILLIPIYGYAAAAWLTLASYIVSALLVYYFSQRQYSLSYQWGRILRSLLITLGFYLSYKFFYSEAIGNDGLSIPLTLFGTLLVFIITKTITLSEVKSMMRIFKRR
ncbi:MAG: oligosaccharide flippase family protein [Candidatus Kapaibacteriales bacterium]